jgi:RNA polymerase sigma-70 factor (TIGR02943 family)
MAVATTKNMDFEKWIADHADDLFKRAFLKTSKREIAEDLVQETFVSAFKSLDKFKAESSGKTWLFSILNNKIIDYYRKKASSFVVSSAESLGGEFVEHGFDENDNWKVNGMEGQWPEDEENLLDNSEFKVVLEKCLNDLPERWRDVMLSKFRLEKEATEICQELGVSASNYWQIIHRAKLSLKKCLELKWFAN